MVLFGIGPAYLFLLQQRLPVGLMRGGLRPWLSAMITNVAIAALSALLIWLIGLGPFLLVHLPITLIGGSAGVWLFYVQHQFEHTYWRDDQNWDLHDAALQGSSHYCFRVSCAGSPRILVFITYITCAAAFRSIGCRVCCASILNSRGSAGSPWCRADPVFASPFGSNRNVG
jgi:hypothetical protein